MRDKGFSLVEVLVAMAVGAILGTVLLAAGRWLYLTSERVSRILLARERGERVLSFLEPRVLHAGLGLASCRSDGALRRAFGHGFSNAPLIARWPDRLRPLQIYKEPSGSWPDQAEDEGGVYCGSGICLLYAVPSGILLEPRGGKAVVLNPGDILRCSVVSGSLEHSVSVAGLPRDLRSWYSLPLTGYPFYWEGGTASAPVLRLAAGVPGPVEIPPLDELLLLRCERFRVMNETLYFQELRDGWYPLGFQPREDGVLSLWFEWRPSLKCLDVWVLTTGGAALFPFTSKPSSWPAEAPWKAAFEHQTLQVVRASWRAENL